jgi:hypothetical protein
MLEKIKIFGLWLLIIIAVIGATVLPIAYYYNVKYRDVTEYNHGIHAIDGGNFEIVNVVNYEGKGSDVRVYLKGDECGEEICVPYFLVK